MRERGVIQRLNNTIKENRTKVAITGALLGLGTAAAGCSSAEKNDYPSTADIKKAVEEAVEEGLTKARGQFELMLNSMQNAETTTTTVFVPDTTSTTIGAAEPNPTTEPISTTTTLRKENKGSFEMGPVGAIIPVPSVISGDMVREVRDGGANKLFSEGEWFHPVYDIGAEDEAHEYRGIGPWYPVAFANLDENAAKLTTHGNVGELVVQGNEGGRVMVAFMQLDAHQTEGAWGTDPETGRFMQNDAWEMQYNFHSLAPYQELFVVDPDTGEGYTWEDGTPVIYRANEQGIAAFAIPKTQGEDVRVGFVFKMPAKIDGVQVPEVKIERGPNDRPGLTGENPLPGTVKKPMVPEK
jgi:hypothetical protein